MEYRTAKAEDLPLITGMLSQSDYYLPTDAARVGGVWVVAVHKGDVVGTIWAFADGYNAFLDYLYVKPNYRDMYVGLKLLATMHALFKEAGVQRVRGVVLSSNEACLHLLNATGAVSVPGYDLMFKEI